jgi:hypothetical protein
VRLDPRGGELRKSRRNRGALHGDFHGDEADVFANYAFLCMQTNAPFRWSWTPAVQQVAFIKKANG